MFNDFKVAVQKQFAKMKDLDLFVVDVTKEALWDTYLSSFPEGSNPMYRERTEHDCNCCKQFIRAVGAVVAVVEGKLVSIWDCEVGGDYQVVADAMDKLVKRKKIANVFLHNERSAGTDRTFEDLAGESVAQWHHFHLTIPERNYCKRDIGTHLSRFRSRVEVMGRALDEITLDSVDTVLELIGQNSLYRGEEHKAMVEAFRRLKVEYNKIRSAKAKTIFCWDNIKVIGSATSGIRNSAIGTLLVDLSEGRDMESAVAAFEAKVAPTNYKRPTSLVTKSMVDNARKKVEELGLTSALKRRHAIVDDLTINNVLYADRSARASMDVFDEIAASAPVNTKKFAAVEKVSIDKFLADIMPKAESLELMVTNKLTTNFVSLLAPEDASANNMLKWGNNFSWSYAGAVADSIKEKVKRAGGSVTGDLRCSLAWYNRDDLDLHMKEPDGHHIYYSDRMSRKTGGNLDVDMNAGGRMSDTPVENICYPDKQRMAEGEYVLSVKNYNQRTSQDVGFEVELEFDGVVHTFTHPKGLSDGVTVSVVRFKYTHKDGIKIIRSLPTTQTSKDVWGMSTQQFHPVSVIMNSPNHWDGEETGNKHYFFMLDDCVNPDKARGFFNEFLDDELRDHRKVFEVLGSKMMVDPADKQLSGLGFSSTKRNSVLCRVTGSFSRVVEVTF